MGIMSNPLLLAAERISAAGNIISLKSGLRININPVQSGSGDPSPSNSMPISGWSTVNLTGTGKNLTGYESGAIELNGTHTENTKRLRTPDYIKVDEGQTYAFNWSTTSGTDTQAFVYYYQDSQHSDALNTASWKSVPFTFTVPVGAKFVTITARRQSNAVLDLSTVTSFQLEQDSTATTYAPYVGCTTPITIPTPPGTVCGGYIEVLEDGTAQLVVTDEMVTYNSSTGWTKSLDYFYLTVPVKYRSARTLLVNWLKGVSPRAWENLNPYEVALTGTNIYINAYVPDVADISAWNTLLAATPLQIVYKLVTPEVYTIPPFIIPIASGTNKVWADSGDIKLSIAK